MRKTVIALSLAASIFIAGCTININTTETTKETKNTTETTGSTEETETTPSETSATTRANIVHVEDLYRDTYSDFMGDYEVRAPKIFVDGVEQTAIDQTLDRFIKDNSLVYSEEYNVYEGYSVKYDWAANDNILSVMIIQEAVREEFVNYTVFNYDLNTMQQIDKEQFMALMGSNVSEFESKLADAFTGWWEDEEWLHGSEDLRDQSIADISWSSTPVLLCDGHLGGIGLVHTDSQISESLKCFDLVTGDIQYFG